MAKSLSSILTQIERLQKEASAIQSEVIGRIRKDIAKYGLTAEQLFGSAPAPRSKTPKKSTKSSGTAAKYADGQGNTWGGRGKRPEWLRVALEAGKSLEEFLAASAPVSPRAKRAVPESSTKRTPAKKTNRTATAKPKAAAKKAAARKPRKSSAEAKTAEA